MLSTRSLHEGISEKQLDAIYAENSGTSYLKSLSHWLADDVQKICKHGEEVFQDGDKEKKIKRNIAKYTLDEMRGYMSAEVAQASRCDEARKLAKMEYNR